MEEVRQGTANMRRRIDDMTTEAEALNRELDTVKASTPKSSKKNDASKTDAPKKKKKPLPMHPLADLVRRGGALAADASVAIILTFGCCGFHTSAVDHVTNANALRGTVVWEFGEGENRQIVYRDMSGNELDTIPFSPRRERPERRNSQEDKGKDHDHDGKEHDDREDSEGEESDD